MTLDRRLIDTEELFDIAKRLGDPVLLGVAALREVRVKIEAAAFDQVDEALDVLEQVAHLDPYVRWSGLCVLAVVAHVRGDFPAALAFAEEARVVGVAEADALAVYAATTAQILWDMGSLGVMVPTIEQTVREHPGVTGFRGILGAGLVEVGRVDDARAILRHEVETEFAEHVLNPVWLITISVFASLAIELEDRDAARMLYRILDPWRGRASSSVVSINGLVTESLAGLAVVAGDLAAAERDVAQALEQANRVGARVSATRTRLTRARLLAARGDAKSTQVARTEAREAAAAAGSIGMGAVERRANELAASLAAART
jgi:ATP/maltotriose-dependent transcriptional regulator MalT